MNGIVFNIQRFSLHDGPGIRTTVFLKGCSLRCFWCHNPEGIDAEPEVQFSAHRCLGDADCARVCPSGAHVFGEKGHVFRREACTLCGACVEVCVSHALEMIGRSMTVAEVMAEILADRAFYRNSGGGVTLSGGEPLVQDRFAFALLECCKAEGLHTAVETAANCRWERLAALLPLTDLVLLDLKHMDGERHRAATGASNRQILANARRLAERGQAMILRIPVVPGVNDGADNIVATARFVCELTRLGRENGYYAEVVPSLELLPFHRLSGQKYRDLGWEDQAAGIQPPGAARITTLTALAAGSGIPVRHR
jgi:pyruvate formate lyase activating enzyme